MMAPLDTNLYANWRDVPMDSWRWPNFSPRELACKGTGSVLIDEDALDKLQALRTALGRPIVITSAYRSPEHNRKVGGAPRSLHMIGTAFDVRMDNHEPWSFEQAAKRAGFTGFGFYPKRGFMHIDTGPAREWGDKWPMPEATSSALPAEPARRKPTESRTIRGGAAATVGGIGVVLAEAAEAVEPLAQTSEVFRWVSAGLVVAGSLWAVYARLDDMRRGRN